MTVQFLEIAGQRVAVLPAADYERLVEAAEDRADEAAARTAQERREGGEEYLPSALIDRIISGESALKVWREHRGMTASALASRADVNIATVSKLELGDRQGRPATWQALAQVLDVTPADIMPAL